MSFYRNLFLNKRLFAGSACSVVLYLFSFFLPWMSLIPELFSLLLFVFILADIFLLFRVSNGTLVRRQSPVRLSNGDENTIGLYAESRYSFPVHLGIIDEIPFQFQKRDVWFKVNLAARQHKLITYPLTPLKRGEYHFGNLQVFVSSPLRLVSRRYTFEQPETLPVYASFLQMRRFELMAISNRLHDAGVKRIRRLGQSMEFEQIRNYVAGDDYRNINWKATARAGEYMVNNYIDERSQNVYCIVDKSRAMKMPFEGLSLLDYAINATLILSDVALHKQDKAGLITVGEKIGAVVNAERRPTQMSRIMEVLYREKTRYLELNMGALYGTIRNVIKQRSLIVLFTNFESNQAMQRQLPFLKRIAGFHLLLVVFFENTELKKLTNDPARDIEEVYVKTVARKFTYEKKLMMMELNRCGIQALLTTPKELTVNTINRYLEIKSKNTL